MRVGFFVFQAGLAESYLFGRRTIQMGHESLQQAKFYLFRAPA